jgi:rhodanese-related sulfurtransferase
MESYIVPVLLVSFIGYKFFQFRGVKKRIPELLKEGAIVVDVRSQAEFAGGSRPGSLNIPLESLNSRSKDLDKNKTILLCCASGTRSGMAVGILKKNGFKSVINAGPWTNTLG